MATSSNRTYRDAVTQDPVQERQRAHAVAAKVEVELQDNLSLVPMDSILDRLYHIHPDVIDRIAKRQDVVASLDKIPLPAKEGEELFYPTFVQLANVINKHYSEDLEVVYNAAKARMTKNEAANIPNNPRDGEAGVEYEKLKQRSQEGLAAMRWVSKANTTPKASDKTASGIKLDVVCTLLPGKPDENKKVPDDTYWVHITTPVEIKPNHDNVEERQKASKQLAEYMRMCLKDQLDRCFIFGLVLCGHKLRVMRCDRSGMEASNWIDIKQDFHIFIRIILGLSILDRTTLGYDNTKKMVLPGSSLPVYSTSMSAVTYMQTHLPSMYDVKWFIFVPSPNGPPGDGTWYLTTKAISLIRSEMMTGRATLAWRVLESKDGTRAEAKDDARPLVLKDAWTPDGELSEAELDPRNDGKEVVNVARVMLSVPVVDIAAPAFPAYSTKVFRPHPPESKLSGVEHVWHDGIMEYYDQVPGAYKKHTNEDEGEQSQRSKTMPGRPKGPDQKTATHHRTLTRTLVEVYGWPLKDFLDLIELVVVIRGAVQGHQSLHFAGVLHRDISSGNLIIYPTANADYEILGYVIDLDHAQKANGWTSCAPDVDDEDVNDPAVYQTMVLSMNREVPRYLRSKQNKRHMANDFLALNEPRNLAVKDQTVLVTPELVKELIEIWKVIKDEHPDVLKKILLRFQNSPLHAASFVGELLAMYGSQSIDKVLAEVNYLLQYPEKELYDKWSREPQGDHVPSWAITNPRDQNGAQITGTFAYMSYEVYHQKSYRSVFTFPTSDSDARKVHSAVHDIESFFWVLLRECLIRDGPGSTHRRLDLRLPFDEDTENALGVAGKKDSGDGDQAGKDGAKKTRKEAVRPVGLQDAAGKYVLSKKDRTKFKNHVYKLFENDNLYEMFETKKLMFTNPEVLDEVVSLIHPYFERLRPLLTDMWRIIRRAHLMSDPLTEACIHEQMLQLFDDHLKELQSGKKTPIEQERDAFIRDSLLDKRRKDLAAGNPPPPP
ncbi:hypothetical protein EIP91_000542 [Steccherinum ochraceum]|uniref:Fungal-type protein kinase domain-containing protein n=1 Tax=Steccherinum ochraceum TaxID=92696 RepID=A0A4R0RU72_9APHY|nr:hypothetical protein EIP91_000542 [Steccherinum ochraceum]